ncbi:hypothetical protein WM40_11605 [Robbsia andropogonis]|uniref:Nitrilotriacetate monooxygenase n=1 Tax=Robbsia andropogonis TaxID=28092 RepID=A0A0F5K0C2_9BURK|nr:hypothetical protein WM40_11605 [Robbsia andropogonis]
MENIVSTASTSNPRRMKLGAFLMETGHHIAAWRHPQTDDAGDLDFSHYAELANVAERAKFDAVFFADNVGINNWDDDAFLRDKDSGRYFDTEKMHVLNY